MGDPIRGHHPFNGFLIETWWCFEIELLDYTRKKEGEGLQPVGEGKCQGGCYYTRIWSKNWSFYLRVEKLILERRWM